MGEVAQADARAVLVTPRFTRLRLFRRKRGSGAGGSKELGIAMEEQDYRGRIRHAILAADSTATIVDPLEMGKERAAPRVLSVPQQ